MSDALSDISKAERNRKIYSQNDIDDAIRMAREEGAKAALLDFDRWFSGRHVGGMSEIIPEVRQEIHKRIKSLRPGQKQDMSKESTSQKNVSKKKEPIDISQQKQERDPE